MVDQIITDFNSILDENKDPQKEFPKIMGFNSTSEAGFNLYAASIFLFGCNLRCPFCMNGRIVVVKPEDWTKPVKTVNLDSVKKHVIDNKVEWVMISGGEPTVTPMHKLINLINEIKSWGAKVSISTNGTNPEALAEILPLINYVAMDFKTANSAIYTKIDVTNTHNSFSNMLLSLSMLRNRKTFGKDFDYEIRTTLYPEYIDLFKHNSDCYLLGDIGKYLNKNETWVLQQFRHAKNMLDEKSALAQTPFTEDIFRDLVEYAKKYSDNVVKRYV